MLVEKRLNNNVVLATENGQPLIVMGKGLGFQKYPNDAVDITKIEKKFYPANNLSIAQMAHLMIDASPKDVETIEQIIKIGRDNIPNKLNDNIFFTLLDHISFALKRSHQEMAISSPLEWEIKRFYREEYQVGQMALMVIEANLGVTLPSTEAAFIALHFVNAQYDLHTNQDIVEITELTNEIVKYVKYYFRCDFDTESFFYNRFVTHVRYYLLRQIKGEKIIVDNTSLLETLKNRFEKEYACVNSIADFLKEKKGWEISESEKMYLILHLNNVIAKVE